MAKVLYNEGRVVGYSAYELYCRQVLAQDPTATPATEREWLASTVAMGSSMLLRVGSDSVSGAHYRDIQFPSDSKLCAANTIIASVFIGEGYIGDDVADTADVWATKVTDYGALLSNDATYYPTGNPSSHSSTIAAKSSVAISDDTMNQVKSYMQITDGLIIQPGYWTDNGNKPPQRDFKPYYNDYPRLRLSFANTVTTPFFIILTGFTNNGVIRGLTGSDTAVNTTAPSDGDFLGPAAFPWAAKVIFNAPPVYLKSLMSASYERKLPSSGTAETVTSTPIIDMENTNPITDYYASHDTDAPITETITAIDVSGDGAAVIATISPADSGTTLPPAMYGGKFTATGSAKIAPLDSVAPHTVHLYTGDTSDTAAGSPAAQAAALETAAPGAKAFARDDSDYVLLERDAESQQMIPVSKISTSSLFGALSSEPRTNPMFYVQGSLRTGITPKWTGADLDTDHSGGTTITNRQAIPAGDTENWYLEISDSIADQYTLETITLHIYDSDAGTWSTTTTTGVSGSAAVANKLKYCGVGCMVFKRITGKFSDEIKDKCGYEGVYDSNGDPAGVFATGGIWENATKDMFGQIAAAERKDYYALIPSDPSVTNAIAYPVRSSDNMVDVTVRYQFSIYVNGNSWNIPTFTNITSPPQSSLYLGSWWNTLAGDRTYDSGTDTYTAMKYVNGWANIDSGVSHPLAYNTASHNATGQVYQQFAMLPVSGYDSMAMNVLFSSTLLADAGIKSEFRSLSVKDFLNMAMYTDMGTGEPLPATSSNIRQPLNIYTNGMTGGSYVKANIAFAFSLSSYNSAATVTKTQLLTIPDEYRDSDSDDPVGLIMQSGRLQGLALSMADKNNTPYGVYGTGGSMQLGDDSMLSWYYLLLSLTQNQKLDILGAVLRGLRTDISGSGPNYIEMSGNGTPVRLYISNTAPTGNIPEGSLGIGW